ncbi:MAG: RnfABCDGE type electron transport complex subunit D [Oscillospiraceae bacterium]|jgi:electron transport complex protein RnfD|nr:RnfABCDGE type electron transport complex subunit D [Oscillospiraceae bacterium]
MEKIEKLTVSASPHLHSGASTQRIMLDVLIALCPALIASAVIFGLRVLALCAVCVAAAVLAEYISRRAMKRPNTVADLSAAVTGLLLAFNLPPGLPFWMAAIGSVAAVVAVKQMFGGIGQNFINPALAGRIILLISFPSAMSKWSEPLGWRGGLDALSGATPLEALANSGALPGKWEMLLGIRGGALGEVCIIALVLGGVYLILRKVISPVIPLCYTGTVALVMLIAGRGDLNYVFYQLCGGGLVLAAVFMATDYTTSPIDIKGRIIFGIGCGLLTALIRLFASLPEGASFSVIIMNILVPHIERLTTPKPFGFVKSGKGDGS